MKESRLTKTTLAASFSYEDTALGYSLSGDWSLTRAALSSLSPGLQKRVHCADSLTPFIIGPFEELILDEMTEDTFLLLDGECRFFAAGNLGFERPPIIRPCRQRCAKFMLAKFSEQVVGMDGEVEITGTMFVGFAPVGVTPNVFARGAATGSTRTESPTVTFVNGSPEIPRDARWLATWGIGTDEMPSSLTATWEWIAPDGRKWRWTVAPLADQYQAARVTLVERVVVDEVEVSITPAIAERDALFRVSANSFGGRIGFIGDYGAQILSAPTLLSQGGTIAALGGRPEVSRASISALTSVASASAGAWVDDVFIEGVEIDGICPPDWACSNTWSHASQEATFTLSIA